MLLEKPWSNAAGITYNSLEVQRVLSMCLPIAVVVKLPRMMETVETGQVFTDLLLYFPADGQVIIFDYTIAKLCEIKFYATKDAFPNSNGTQRKVVINDYKYAVELTPFAILHSSQCPNVAIGSFMIHCNATAGVSGIEIRCHYNDRERDKEFVELFWFDGGNESTLEFKKIAEWKPIRENKTLLWESKQGSPFISELYHIDEYFAEDDKED
jgi:hypothetical protein